MMKISNERDVLLHVRRMLERGLVGSFWVGLRWLRDTGVITQSVSRAIDLKAQHYVGRMFAKDGFVTHKGRKHSEFMTHFDWRMLQFRIADHLLGEK